MCVPIWFLLTIVAMHSGLFVCVCGFIVFLWQIIGVNIFWTLNMGRRPVKHITASCKSMWPLKQPCKVDDGYYSDSTKEKTGTEKPGNLPKVTSTLWLQSPGHQPLHKPASQLPMLTEQYGLNEFNPYNDTKECLNAPILKIGKLRHNQLN